MKWTPEIKQAVSDTNECKREWRSTGAPTDPHHQTNIDKKLAKKNLRRIQRQQQAIDKQTLYDKISDAHTDQQKLSTN